MRAGGAGGATRFLEGGRFFAAYMALQAVIERARVAGERLYVAFVHVRRAFPSVRRDLLWRKLNGLGASDSLTRARIALYADAQVRGVRRSGSPPGKFVARGWVADRSRLAGVGRFTADRNKY